MTQPTERPDEIAIIAEAIQSVCSDGNSDARAVAADVVRALERNSLRILWFTQGVSRPFVFED